MFFCNSLIKHFLNLKLDYQYTGFIVRLSVGFLALLNSSINQFIYIKYSQIFKSNMKNMPQKLLCFKDRNRKSSDKNSLFTAVVELKQIRHSWTKLVQILSTV